MSSRVAVPARNVVPRSRYLVTDRFGLSTEYRTFLEAAKCAEEMATCGVAAGVEIVDRRKNLRWRVERAA
jgi:hypothetical protein